MDETKRRQAKEGASHPQNPLLSQVAALFSAAVRSQQAGRLEEAECLYERILILDSNHADSHNNLGLIARQQGKGDLAIERIGQAVAMAPSDPLFHYSLGNAFLEAGRAAEAAAQYQYAVSLKPDYFEAHHNLAVALREEGNLDGSFVAFQHAARLRYSGAGAGVESDPPHRRKHDREQLAYLIETGAGGATVHRGAQELSGTAAPARGDGLFRGLFHLEGGARLSAPVINPHNAPGQVEARWKASSPNLVIIDGLLTTPALEALRRFCLGSTVWRHAYKGGYLGAFPETGFACPLLAQIAGELRAKLPAIMGRHKLTQWWAFKYDSALSGINLHADFAAVNVNFWITPDEANLDANSGGLVVWDRAAPPDWDFDKYNRDEAAARAFLQAAGAKPVVVPYRANRAVIFDSGLFHETDRMRFRQGYLNRRINITMLYGVREEPHRA